MNVVALSVPTPAVGPELKSISPSQIKEYKLCPRKWWLDKRAKIPQPQSEAAALGEKIHAVLEAHYGFGTAVLLENYPAELHTGLRSYLAMAEQGDVPRPSPGVMVEQPRNYVMGIKSAGVPVRGRIDLIIPPNAQQITTVVDWKTSKWSSYRKTAEELVNDEQCIIYARYAFEKIPGTEAVVFAHGALNVAEVDGEYIPTDPLLRAEVDAKHEQHIAPVVQKMVADFAIDDFHKVPLPPGAPSASYGSPCRAFGGCPYASICGVDLSARHKPPTEAPEPHMEMSFKEKMAEHQAKLAKGINPPDAAISPAVTPYRPPDVHGAVNKIYALIDDVRAAVDSLKALLG